MSTPITPEQRREWRLMAERPPRSLTWSVLRDAVPALLDALEEAEAAVTVSEAAYEEQAAFRAWTDEQYVKLRRAEAERDIERGAREREKARAERLDRALAELLAAADPHVQCNENFDVTLHNAIAKAINARQARTQEGE